MLRLLHLMPKVLQHQSEGGGTCKQHLALGYCLCSVKGHATIKPDKGMPAYPARMRDLEPLQPAVERLGEALPQVRLVCGRHDGRHACQPVDRASPHHAFLHRM